jgi:hypothetical protein
MTISKRAFGNRVAAVVSLLAAGGGLLYNWSHHSFVILAASLSLILIALYFSRRARGKASEGSPVIGRLGARADAADPSVLRRVGPMLWGLSALSVLAVGVAYFLLYRDGLGGYHQVWPVYVFAGAGVVAAGVVGSLVAKLVA